MVSPHARRRAVERIDELGRERLDATGLRRGALDVIREVVGFDAYVWVMTDPVTTVGTAPLADVPCLPELPALIKAKYATTINRWTTLSSAHPVALLNDAVDGALDRSLVWRTVLCRYGVRDVASIVFLDHYGCWAFLDLWRSGATFSEDDAALLTELTVPLTQALRQAQADTFVEPATPRRIDVGPVVVMLHDDLTIASRTAASRDWLDTLLPPGPEQRTVPASVYNVAAQLLATEVGVDAHAAEARTHLAGGLWLTLRAARLAADGSELTEGAASIVVTIEEASAAERLDLFGRAFGLSGREAELLALLATGSDTRAMSRQMAVSEHTVQDHLKSIFAKTDARDRVTILTRALGTRRQ